MIIQTEGIGKKFGREWIFKGFDYKFTSNKKYAITGKNGSGKSTLLKILAAAIPSSTGKVNYTNKNGEIVLPDKVFNYLTFMAPYMELIEEFSLHEFLTFYTNFKPLNISTNLLIEELRFSSAKNKQIRNFSSGMKQRLQLGLALFSKAEVVFLDEPTSNLDQYTSDWYLDTVMKTTNDRLVIISSNQQSEYVFCDEVIHLDEYK
ncbi:MAG: ABC transporter ATP-binding protein [Flammeovirgaceae bacterium]